jgi:hypothetical protein
MLLNHASPWADVRSADPYEGRVDARMRKECRSVRFRAPEWLSPGDGRVGIAVNGASRRPAWDGAFVGAGGARAGDLVSFTYPISEYVTRELLGDTTYTLTVKGRTVVGIDPKGRHCPLFQREHYRAPYVLWRNVTRYLPEAPLQW